MAKKAIKRVAAVLSVSPTNNTVYVPGEAQEILGVGYNDEVAAIFPEVGPGEGDLRFTGFINRADSFHIGQSARRALVNDNHDKAQHFNGYVESLGGRWEDEKEPTERRWDGSYHHRAEPAD